MPPITTYRGFMENKNIIIHNITHTATRHIPKTQYFVDVKFQKKTLNLMKVLLVLIKKRRGTGWTPRYTEYQKGKDK